VITALDFSRPEVSNRRATASLLSTNLLNHGGTMNLLDALRHAEQQGRKTVHRGAEKIHSIESSIRRKVSGENRVRASGNPVAQPEPSNAPQGVERTGIVSVNGRDVEQIRCTGGRRSA
jgi:hypothetical protein